MKRPALMAFIAIICSLNNLHATEAEDAENAFEKGDYRDSIEIYQQLLKKTSKDQQGALKAKIALAYYRDQEDEKAFKTYLEALDIAPHLTPAEETPEEKELYDEALKLYLENTGPAAHDAANTIREKYSGILALHPNYYHLNFIVAAAYANLGMFDEFFDKFYKSYQYFPDSFMAYKTKAILNIKLYEKARTPEEKELERKRVFENATKANETNSKDASLYRMIISFSPDAEHNRLLIDNVKKIIKDNIMVSRTDIMYYVRELVKVKQPELAQQFIDKAKQWYQYSKILQAAQEYLNENK